MTMENGEPPPRLWELLLIWFGIGIQSFGGGSTTLYLIRQAAIGRGWLSEPEFIKVWALVQIAPGINLIKLTTVIGHRLRGWPGVWISVAGLLLPTGAITALMTAGFATIRDLPWVQAAMKGVIPATVGISIALDLQMASGPLKRARREGVFSLGVHLLLLIGAALMLALLRASPVLVLLMAGLSAVLLLGDTPAAILNAVCKRLHEGWPQR